MPLEAAHFQCSILALSLLERHVTKTVNIQGLMLLISGDIHPHPGPNADNADSSSVSTESYAHLLNSGLSVMHLNIQSLKPKLDILQIESQPYDLLIFTETWLSQITSNGDLYISNFNLPFRCDRPARHGGGVAIYVREGIHATRRSDLEVNGIESVWIEIITNRKKIIIGGIYRPPDSNNNHWVLLEETIDRAFNQVCDNIIVSGDFNINVHNSDANKISRLITSYDAEQLISTPTHFTENSSSLIDLIFVKDARQIITSFVADPFIPDLIRYHCPVVAVIKSIKSTITTYKRKIWLYDQGNYDEFRNKLNAVNWQAILNNENFDTTADSIANSIINAASDTIPNKLVTIRPNDIPWFNNNIRKLLRKRKKAHKKAKLANTESAWSEFRKLRNEVTKLIRKCKSEYEAKIIEKVNDPNTTAKDWFKLVKQLKSKNNSTTIPTLIDDGNEAISDEDKTELLNKFFSKQSTIDDSLNRLPPTTPLPLHNLSTILISPTDVIDAISLVNPSKASGPDLISPRLLREGARELSVPLSNYFNKLISNSVFPSPWKLANVTPIFKKSDPTDPQNYRPISLLSCIGKLMERCVHKYLYNFLITNNKLTPFQSGFIKGDSTVNQLTYIYNDICKALDEGKEVRAVFCDISKAFDRVWHKGLLYKLSSLGITGSLPDFFSSYLSKRRQRVVYGNSSSSWASINAGVPQGSILGPLLFFNIYQ